MKDVEKIWSIIVLLEKIVVSMKKSRLCEEDIENVEFAIEEINLILYQCKRLKFQKAHNKRIKEYKTYIDEIEKLIATWKQTIKRRSGKKIDIDFWEMYEYFKYVDADTIYNNVLQYFWKLPESSRIEYLTLPKRYTFLEGKIDWTKNDFSLIRRYVDMMSKQVEDYRWLYEHLADNRSRMVLNGIIRYWFDFNIDKMHALSETVFCNYYDLDILECDENEVFVDLGAYNGDSVIDFINTYGKYKRIYAYELTPSTYNVMVQNLMIYPNVISVQKGVSNQSGVMYVNDIKCRAGNKILQQGDTRIDIVTLDEDINEPITVIKMDIEGAEKDAILGANHHIKKDKPKMLISSYHLAGDIFDIPRLIDGIRDDYKYYMRFNGRGLWPCDYILFAV